MLKSKSMNKISAIIIACLLFLSFKISAQGPKYIHMPEHDGKAYYFGLSFAGNYSHFQVKPSESFYKDNLYKQVLGKWGPGFNVGIMGHLKLTNFIDLRFIPAIVFSEKSILFQKFDEEQIEVKNIESIYMNLPLQLKFKSDRINNFRFYGLIGGKFDYDLASNAKSRRADEWLRIKPLDLGIDIGIGLEFYFPNFIMAPEIKIGQGMMNRVMHDSDIPLSNEISELRERMITFSIHLQG